jgi:hypothetical protein
MLSLFSILAMLLVFWGGAFFAWDQPFLALTLTALGAGWFGILFATATTMARRNPNA